MAPPPTPASDNGSAGSKRKRRPAGTPDPDAEVVALSPKTLMESDRYVCEICNQGFQRDQNLQMHRRRHKVPWKLLKRENPEVRKRVFVCPEPACLHHDPRHALGDLVGIKKHYRRKHSDHRQWACARCSKAYAVHSDYKAHLKTCGTRGHSCDCGRVFSRVESFIEHQDICNATRTAVAPSTPAAPPGASPPVWLGLTVIHPPPGIPFAGGPQLHHGQDPELIQLLPASASSLPSSPPLPSPPSDDAASTQLHLSIGPCGAPRGGAAVAAATEEKRAADEARRQARRQVEAAEAEFVEARRMRQEARVELCKAQLLRDSAAEQVSRTLMQITCGSCRRGGPLHSPAADALAFGLRCASATGGGDHYHGCRRDDCTGSASEV